MNSAILVQLTVLCVFFLSNQGCQRHTEGCNEADSRVRPLGESGGGGALTGPYALCPLAEINEEYGVYMIESSSESSTNPADFFGTLQVNTFSAVDRAAATDQKLRDLRCILSISFSGRSPYKWKIGPDEIVITNSRDQTELRVSNPRSRKPPK